MTAPPGPAVDPPASYLAKFERMARALYCAVRGRTGPVTIHFAQGLPNAADVPGPPQRIVLDKPARRVHTERD